jgi:hypothetical protein
LEELDFDVPGVTLSAEGADTSRAQGREGSLTRPDSLKSESQKEDESCGKNQQPPSSTGEQPNVSVFPLQNVGYPVTEPRMNISRLRVQQVGRIKPSALDHRVRFESAESRKRRVSRIGKIRLRYGAIDMMAKVSMTLHDYKNPEETYLSTLKQLIKRGAANSDFEEYLRNILNYVLKQTEKHDQYDAEKHWAFSLAFVIKLHLTEIRGFRMPEVEYKLKLSIGQYHAWKHKVPPTFGDQFFKLQQLKNVFS